jgi:hypothetical protein
LFLVSQNYFRNLAKSVNCVALLRKIVENGLQAVDSTFVKTGLKLAFLAFRGTMVLGREKHWRCVCHPQRFSLLIPQHIETAHGPSPPARRF